MSEIIKLTDVNKDWIVKRENIKRLPLKKLTTNSGIKVKGYSIGNEFLLDITSVHAENVFVHNTEKTANVVWVLVVNESGKILGKMPFELFSENDELIKTLQGE